MSNSYRYKAFISYSHADERIAGWLHRRIESYRPPKTLIGQEGRRGIIPDRLRPVFRDREELTASTELGTEIQRALQVTEFLVELFEVSDPREAGTDSLEVRDLLERAIARRAE